MSIIPDTHVLMKVMEHTKRKINGRIYCKSLDHLSWKLLIFYTFRWLLFAGGGLFGEGIFKHRSISRSSSFSVVRVYSGERLITLKF